MYKIIKRETLNPQIDIITIAKNDLKENILVVTENGNLQISLPISESCEIL